MAHQPYVSWMQAVLDGELALEARQQLEAHLAACLRCQATWHSLSAMERLLRAQPVLAPRAGFGGRFNARLAQRRARPRLVWGGVALGAGAVALTASVVPFALGLLLSLVSVIRQPAATLAVAASLNATAGLLESLLDAVYIAGRALLGGLAGNPLAWAGALLALTLTAVWVYVMGRLVPEGNRR